MENQVVSKKRVTDHGEVYTHKREVNAMPDLVRQETERIESRFLKPACGKGNFLAEILERKLRIVEQRYRRSQLEYERNAVLAVSSIYGIDILEDNVIECRNAVIFILERNIIWGDALTLKTVGDNPEPIIFSEWSPVKGSLFKRRDFAFHELLPDENQMKLPLFSAPDRPLFSDQGEKTFIPLPVKEFPLTHFLRIADAADQL